MKKDKTPNFIRVGILTVITTVSWIFFSAYRTLTTKPSPSVPTEVLAPLDPTLDTGKINEMEQRLFFEEGIVTLIESPTPSPTPTESTESGEISP